MDMAQRIFEIDDEKVLDEVQVILNPATGDDWYENLNDEEKSEVAEADADIVAGSMDQNSKVMERLRKWTRR